MENFWNKILDNRVLLEIVGGLAAIALITVAVASRYTTEIPSNPSNPSEVPAITPETPTAGQANYGSFGLLDTSAMLPGVPSTIGAFDLVAGTGIAPISTFELSDGRVLFFNCHLDAQGGVNAQLLTLNPASSNLLVPIADIKLYNLIQPFTTLPVATLLSNKTLLIAWASYPQTSYQPQRSIVQMVTYDLASGTQTTLPVLTDSHYVALSRWHFNYYWSVMPFIAGIKNQGVLIAPSASTGGQLNLYYYDLAAKSWSAIDTPPVIIGAPGRLAYFSSWPQLQIGNKLLFLGQDLYEFDADHKTISSVWQPTGGKLFFDVSKNKLGCTADPHAGPQMEQINSHLIWIGGFSYTVSPSTTQRNCAYLYDLSTSQLYYQKVEALPLKQVMHPENFLQAIKAGGTATSILNDPTIVGLGGYGIVPLTDGTALVTTGKTYDLPWNFGLLDIQNFSWLKDATAAIPGSPQTNYWEGNSINTTIIGPAYLTLNKTGQVLIWNGTWCLLYTPASAQTSDQLTAKQSLESSSPLAGTNWKLVTP